MFLPRSIGSLKIKEIALVIVQVVYIVALSCQPKPPTQLRIFVAGFQSFLSFS